MALIGGRRPGRNYGCVRKGAEPRPERAGDGLARLSGTGAGPVRAARLTGARGGKRKVHVSFSSFSWPFGLSSPPLPPALPGPRFPPRPSLDVTRPPTRHEELGRFGLSRVDKGPKPLQSSSRPLSSPTREETVSGAVRAPRGRSDGQSSKAGATRRGGLRGRFGRAYEPSAPGQVQGRRYSGETPFPATSIQPTDRKSVV